MVENTARILTNHTQKYCKFNDSASDDDILVLLTRLFQMVKISNLQHSPDPLSSDEQLGYI